MAWVTDVRAVPDFVATTIDVLNEIGRRGATVGLVGFENLHGSTESQITTALPSMSFERVTKPFLVMRAIKTTDEMDMVRRSAALADSVLEELSSAIRVGISENEIFARAEYLLILGGAEDHFLLGSSEPKTVMPMPAERSLREHDVVRFSVEAAAPGGFWTQTIRVFSLGEPTPEIRNAFDLCVEALEQAREKLRSRTTGGEIARVMIGVLERAGGGHIGPLGHGMGLDLTEPPYVHSEDETVIESNMVIAIHPYLTWDKANVWIGDTFLVTEDGTERLSRSSTDLRVL